MSLRKNLKQMCYKIDEGIIYPLIYFVTVIPVHDRYSIKKSNTFLQQKNKQTILFISTGSSQAIERGLAALHGVGLEYFFQLLILSSQYCLH